MPQETARAPSFRPSSALRLPAGSTIPPHATRTGKTASAPATPRQTRPTLPARQAGKPRLSATSRSPDRISSKDTPPSARREPRRTTTRRPRLPPAPRARENPGAPPDRLPPEPPPARRPSRRPVFQNRGLWPCSSGTPPLPARQTSARRTGCLPGRRRPAGRSWTKPAYNPAPEGPPPCIPRRN